MRNIYLRIEHGGVGLLPGSSIPILNNAILLQARGFYVQREILASIIHNKKTIEVPMRNRNTSYVPAFEKLFHIVNDSKQPSEETLLSFKSLIQSISELDKIRQLEIAYYQKINSDNPELKLEIPKKLSIDTQNEEDDTLLLCAVYNNYTEIASQLIEAKASPNLINNDGDTALICASNNGNMEIVTQLIDAKASLNDQNNDGDSAMICAARAGHLDIINALVNKKANLELETDDNCTALDEAVLNKRLPIVNTLLNHGAIVRNPKALYEFIKIGDQRDPDVLSILAELCRQQKTIRETAKADASQFTLTDEDYLLAQDHLEKLATLEKRMIQTDDHRKKILDTIYEAQIPKVLSNIITDYDYPPLSALPFFKTADLGTVLTQMTPGQKLNGSDAKFDDSKKEYLDFSNLIETLSKLGKDYFNTHIGSYMNNQDAAHALSKINLNYYHNYDPDYSDRNREIRKLQEKRLISELKIIFNQCTSHVLKFQIKHTLMMYEPFSRFNLDQFLSENAFAKPPSRNFYFKKTIPLDQLIKKLRCVGKYFATKNRLSDHNDLDAAEKLRHILISMTGIPIEEDRLKEMLLKEVGSIYNLIKSDLFKTYIKDTLAMYQPYSQINFDLEFSQNAATKTDNTTPRLS